MGTTSKPRPGEVSDASNLSLMLSEDLLGICIPLSLGAGMNTCEAEMGQSLGQKHSAKPSLDLATPDDLGTH